MIATELHPDTRRIIALLETVPVDGIVTHAAISGAIGRDIEPVRHLLYSAIRHMEREHGTVFACVRKQGYRRMPATEIALIGATARSRIRRTARRSIRSMEAGLTGANDMPNDVRLKVLAEQSALSMVEHLSRERNLPPMQEAETRPLALADTARAFLRSIGAAKEAP